MRAEGTHQSRFLPYDETLKPAEAEAAAVALDTILPGVAGTLGVGHPTACEALRVEATGRVRRCCEAPVYVGRFSATGEPSVLLGAYWPLISGSGYSRIWTLYEPSFCASYRTFTKSATLKIHDPVNCLHAVGTGHTTVVVVVSP